MGIKYTTQTSTTYADDTLPDDGSQTEANRISVNTIRTNFTDPIKDLADSINNAIVDYFSVPTRTTTGNTTTLATDHGTLIQASATATVTMIAAATAGSGYWVKVANTSSSGTVTIAVQTGESLNGTTNGTMTLAAGEAAIIQCIHEETGYVCVASYTSTDLTNITCNSITASGNATIGGTLSVSGTSALAAVTATSITANTITASGNVGVGGTLTVAGTSALAAVTATSIVANTITASGNAGVGGTLTVAGTSSLAAVTATTIVANTITASGNVGIGGTLTVAGNADVADLIADNITASGTIVAGTLVMGGGSITDSSGAISFGNEDLSTDGKVDYQRFEEDVYNVGSVATATTISFANGSTQTVTLTGNATLTFAGEPTSGQMGSIMLIITVSGGAYTPTLAYGGGTERTPFGDAIAFTGTNGAIDVITVFTTDGGSNFYVSPFIMNAS